MPLFQFLFPRSSAQCFAAGENPPGLLGDVSAGGLCWENHSGAKCLEKLGYFWIFWQLGRQDRLLISLKDSVLSPEQKTEGNKLN